MGFFDVIKDLGADIVNGFTDVFSSSDDISCACCKKCHKEYIDDNFKSKRVFRCGYDGNIGNYTVGGIPVLATEYEELRRCLLPCKPDEYIYQYQTTGAENFPTFEPYNPKNMVEQNPNIQDYTPNPD